MGYAVGNMELQLPKYLIQPGEKVYCGVKRIINILQVVIIDELLTNGGVIDAAFNILHKAVRINRL